jgi:hypothetical protein
MATGWQRDGSVNALFFRQVSGRFQLHDTYHFCEEFDFTVRKKDEAPQAKKRFDQLFGD